MAEFDKLTLTQRANVLWKDGKLLSSTVYKGRKVNLYSLKGRFIEMWYDEAGDLIESIIPMSVPELFQNYLQEN